MKNNIQCLLLFAIIFSACNKNQPKDLVEKADSTNNEKMDTAAASNEVITTDQETSMFLVTAADGGSSGSRAW